MQAEIISVGNELLLGHVVNTDGALVARFLAEWGVGTQHIQVVGDHEASLEEALRLAAQRSDLIFTTGGLGPTPDDLTRDAVAILAGQPLVEHEAAMAAIGQYFGDRPMSANQRRQALAPATAIMLPNSLGTAPGWIVSLATGQRIIMLPGPPAELRAMLDGQVRPYLEVWTKEVIHSTLVRTFGMGEGAAAECLGPLCHSANPTVATYAHGVEMCVKVTARASTLEEAQRLCAPAVASVKATLGDVVYGVDVASLEEVVVGELQTRGLTVATAESCTGGLLAQRITNVSGASAVFPLGLVTYSNKSKMALLHVESDLLERWGAVSEPVARAMASNVRRVAGVDFGLGITGIAGPTGAVPGKPLGLVYIALAWGGECQVYEMRWPGRYPGREVVRQRAASYALDLLRRHLFGLPLKLAW